MKRIYTTYIVIVALAICFLPVTAQLTCGDAAATDQLNINNVSADIGTAGRLFWDGADSGYEVPAGSGKNSLFAASLWLGGIDDSGLLRVAGQTYCQTGTDYYPGPLDAEGDATPGNELLFDRLFKVDRSEIDAAASLIASGGSVSIEDFPASVTQWPGKDNPHFTLFSLPSSTDLAPFHDVNGDGIYNPLDGDTPRINGDQGVWTIFHDQGTHGETNGAALGVEVSILAYAFAGENAMDPIAEQTFYEVQLHNASDSNLSDFYLGLWFDIDIGYFYDDFIGCFPDENLAFGYNGDADDEGEYGYGTDIPAIAVKLYKGMDDENGVDLGMTNLISYENDFEVEGNPTEMLEFYYYLQSLNGNGVPFSGTEGAGNAVYSYSGNPSDATEISECSEGSSPGDRRFLLSSGPSQLEASEKQIVHFGVLWSTGFQYPCPDLTPLADLADDMETRLGSILEVEPPMDAVILGIDDIEAAFTLSPNPVTGRNLNVALFDESTESSVYSIYNLKGDLVLQRETAGSSTSVDLPAELSNGLYVMRVNVDQKVWDEKFLLLR